MADLRLSHPVPDFLVIGQGKAGTSLLFRRLQKVPQVGLSHPKELHFFSAKNAEPLDWYTDRFAHLAGQDLARVGEISPSYLKLGVAAKIARVLGRDIQIVFILRHPVEQAYSRYLQNICATGEGGSFTPIMERASRRLDVLFSAIAEYYDIFGSERILPLVFERDVAAPGEIYLRRVLDFIGLGEVRPALATREVNSGVMPRYLFSGSMPLHLTAQGAQYTVPAGTLVFCAQERNSAVVSAPPKSQVLRAFRQQSGWSTNVSAAEFGRWSEAHVQPFAARLEAAFGLDLSVWQGRARDLFYPLAAPPKIFLSADPVLEQNEPE